MNHVRITLRTAGRILRQLLHDHRSVAMIVGVPTILMTLLYFMFKETPTPPGQPRVFDSVGAVMLGFFPFFLMFIITSITTLRERTGGTLERLLTTPLAKIDLILGYAIAFALTALVQVAFMVGISVWLFDLNVQGGIGWVLLIAVVDALLGIALGLLASAFAQTEFQAVQFIPALIVPQALLCGLFVARDQMAGWLNTISDYLPLTYAVQAMKEIATHEEPTQSMYNSILIVALVSVGCLILGAATLRRRTA